MSIDIRELYQEVIMDHNRHPKNHYAMENPTQMAEGYNPLCGDKVTVYIRVGDAHLEAISFLGCGCAISQASASMMVSALEGKALSELQSTIRNFYAMLLEDACGETLGDLSILMGVKAYPARVKCATLAWHTLESALKKEPTVKTQVSLSLEERVNTDAPLSPLGRGVG
jgi:nitrogen fixation NifU-like protein